MAENTGEPSYLAKNRLNSKISSLEAEIVSVDADIQQLRTLRQNLLAEKTAIQRELDLLTGRVGESQALNGDAPVVGKGKGKAKFIDYSEEFEWTPGLKDKMKRVFGIKSFRLCQEGWVRYIDLFDQH